MLKAAESVGELEPLVLPLIGTTTALLWCWWPPKVITSSGQLGLETRQQESGYPPHAHINPTTLRNLISVNSVLNQVCCNSITVNPTSTLALREIMWRMCFCQATILIGILLPLFFCPIKALCSSKKLGPFQDQFFFLFKMVDLCICVLWSLLAVSSRSKSEVYNFMTTTNNTVLLNPRIYLFTPGVIFGIPGGCAEGSW